jgi:dopamine D2-like receptor
LLRFVTLKGKANKGGDLDEQVLQPACRSDVQTKKESASSRFTIYKVHKASKRKRERSSAKKENKATKTLAIVLGKCEQRCTIPPTQTFREEEKNDSISFAFFFSTAVFLVCWVPFFTCNILEAISLKLEEPDAAWRPGVTLFLTTTWLGYINSFMNPIIYTVWNMEFRKAFRKILLSTCP